MIDSRSPLDRHQILDRLHELLNPSQIETDETSLQEASVDRFKKYQSAHGIFTAPLPVAIVYATSTADVASVLEFADENLVNIVPRSGRTGTEGGLETSVADTIVLDVSRMNRVLSIDPENMQVTVEAGVTLQSLEDVLRAQGLTTGHSPQSKPLAQYGGLVSTRSIGQFSTLYGAIEDMVVGLETVFPGGRTARIKAVPRRAAGPDIRHVVIGNEGALSVITEVTLKVFRHYPHNNEFRGALVDDMRTGIAILREVITNGFHPSVARLYSPEDADQHFSHFSQGKCVVVFVAEGPRGLVRATSEEIMRVLDLHEHDEVDPALIEDWFDHLNWGQDKIDAEKVAMLDSQHLGYTTEVSANWSQVADLYDAVIRRVREEYPHAEDLTMLGGHSSHSYQTGTNMYFVYDYRIDASPEEEIEKYHLPLNAIIVEEALRHEGSMVHHHGIGKYRTPWTEQEHGTAYPVLAALKETFDPNGIMNKGTIIPAQGAIQPEAAQPQSRESGRDLESTDS
ncbi:FAD-binding oxidoreductase [Brachybacterium fresconis]|uniref:Alkyldihydroxyacetonephosphate synthase n=1 Tax=Brachybacterium fresconis TaxID=173363 RepID=A0ABS4YN69_9MICO|nr:FAD-binding oxidoreductase [Brachybacterium fresconis]MBP2410245.1 alkyldihydroxyacetonephosphate synthase [Brachybacterium fresconis]